MSDKTSILIKADKKVKAKAQRAAKEIGIPLGTVMGMYLRKFAQEQRIEFEVPLVPNKRTAKSLRQSQREFDRGTYAGPFTNLDDLFESLVK